MIRKASSVMIAGPSGCGKTQLVDDLLTEQRVFQRPPTEIVYCYGVWQPRFTRVQKKRGSISSRDSHPDSIGHVVPRPDRGASGLGRSHGRRGERQTHVGFIHQRLPSSKHHGLLPDARFVSPRKICQDHQPKCELCHRL